MEEQKNIEFDFAGIFEIKKFNPHPSLLENNKIDFKILIEKFYEQNLEHYVNVLDSFYSLYLPNLKSDAVEDFAIEFLKSYTEIVISKHRDKNTKYYNKELKCLDDNHNFNYKNVIDLISIYGKIIENNSKRLEEYKKIISGIFDKNITFIIRCFTPFTTED